MLSFLMFDSLLQLIHAERKPAITSFIAILCDLSPLSRYCSKLLADVKKVISFEFSTFQTLLAKHRAWGVPVVSHDVVPAEGVRLMGGA